MKEKLKSTFRKLEYHRTESFYLIVRGIEVGIASGLICVLYRFLLSGAEKYLYIVIDYVKGNPIKTALWLFLLSLLGAAVSFIIKWEPLAGGSGIPQVTGEIRGHLSHNWLRVIFAKLIGSTVSVFAGLSLGREGPSIQFGAMAAKGAAKMTKADKTTELRMISCGAGAGMAAAFNSPLAGIMFVLEEIHHTFDKAILCMGIVATITADFVSKLFFGQGTVFHYNTENLPLRYYWLLVLFGILLGMCGSLYNIVMVKGQDLYKKITKIPAWLKLALVFAASGVAGLLLPQVLCGGHSMVDFLIQEHPSVSLMLCLLTAKFFFGAFSFSSGAPGGTLYPLTVLGTYIGAVFGEAAMNVFHLKGDLREEFIVLGMAGLFASIVRAPITGVIVVFEITGNMKSLLPLVAVSLVSYATANMLGSKPFYSSLLSRILKNSEDVPQGTGEKVLRTLVVPMGSWLHGKRISDVEWGRHCLIVSVERNEKPITPKGDFQIMEGDELVFLISQRRFSRDITRLEKLVNGE